LTVSGPTHQRDLATATAAQDPHRALELARRIEHPWYRCQALAGAGLQLRDGRVLEEAFASAATLTEPNRIVTVSSWPLKALVQLGEDASAHVERLLAIIATEPSPVRRGDALLHVFRAAPTMRVAETLVATCLERLEGDRRNRRGETMLERNLVEIARVDQALAKRAKQALRRSAPPA
jgi:hypothetical protein